MSRSVSRFWVLFGLFGTACAVLSASSWADHVVHEPLSRFLAMLSGSILSRLGPTVVDGSLVQFREFGMRITEACDGIVPAYIYMAAVLAFPSSVTAKIWGVTLGVPALFLINLIRIVSLLIVGEWRPDLFEQVHIYVWQVIVIGLSMAVWVWWVERCVRTRPRLAS